MAHASSCTLRQACRYVPSLVNPRPTPVPACPRHSKHPSGATSYVPSARRESSLSTGHGKHDPGALAASHSVPQALIFAAFSLPS